MSNGSNDNDATPGGELDRALRAIAARGLVPVPRGELDDLRRRAHPGALLAIIRGELQPMIDAAVLKAIGPLFAGPEPKPAFRVDPFDIDLLASQARGRTGTGDR